MTQIELRDKNIYPSPEVLRSVLKDSYPALRQLFAALAKKGFSTEWRFYHDGKAWLCKITDSKKTLAWLSVYTGCFRVSFHFPERRAESIMALDINPEVKRMFLEAKPSGRLIPLTYTVAEPELPDDILTVFLFKQSAK